MRPTDRVRTSETGNATLDWLTEQRRLLAKTPPDSSFYPNAWQEHDLAPLMGLPRTTIVAALGPPDVCPKSDGTPCPYSDGADIYALFQLSPYQVGGGPHIVLTYDARGICTEVRWFATK